MLFIVIFGSMNFSGPKEKISLPAEYLLKNFLDSHKLFAEFSDARENERRRANLCFSQEE